MNNFRYYQEILKSWGIITYMPPSLASVIAFQVIWYNKYINIDKKTFYNLKMATFSLTCFTISLVKLLFQLYSTFNLLLLFHITNFNFHVAVTC